MKRNEINNLFLLFPWLHLGKPHRPPCGYDLHAPLSKGQRSMLGRLESILESWASCPPVQLTHLGRAAGKVQRAEECLSKLEVISKQLRVELGTYCRGSSSGGA